MRYRARDCIRRGGGMVKKLSSALLVMLLLTSCAKTPYEPLKISATTWIGYSPLFYAKEQGWLSPLNIKLLHVSSLSENMYLFQAGNADAYVGTQYEYSVLSKNDASMLPVMLFDRSYGGDIVMSNWSVEKLKATSRSIDVYLEMDSVNSLILKDFIKNYGLKDKQLNYRNEDQASISLLQAPRLNRPSLVITYAPYNIALEKQGFNELASTRDGLGLLVVDALFTRTQSFEKHTEQFHQLKTLVDRAVNDLHADPYAFYQVVKPYMLEVSYEEFETSLQSIIWVNQGISDELDARIKQANFPTRGLI